MEKRQYCIEVIVITSLLALILAVRYMGAGAPLLAATGAVLVGAIVVFECLKKANRWFRGKQPISAWVVVLSNLVVFVLIEVIPEISVNMDVILLYFTALYAYCVISGYRLNFRKNTKES